MTNYSLQNTSPYGLEYKNIPMTILLLYDRFLYVYLVILFVTCVFSDQFAKGVCQVHVLLMSCYFNHVGNVMPCVSYIVLNLVWDRLSVFTSKIFSYLLKNAFERWDKYLNIIDLIVTNVWGDTISEYKLEARM
jgi:hypothetical protein